ncbi:hypothetical protein SESBI_27645 [Sesbania bispinosa]|nr:hypothetical protein SESBI_27645 [Sesbania bispinosa]
MIHGEISDWKNAGRKVSTEKIRLGFDAENGGPEIRMVGWKKWRKTEKERLCIVWNGKK